MEQKRQKQLGTLIALLIITEIVLHFCFDVIDQYFFQRFLSNGRFGNNFSDSAFGGLVFSRGVGFGFVWGW